VAFRVIQSNREWQDHKARCLRGEFKPYHCTVNKSAEGDTCSKTDSATFLVGGQEFVHSYPAFLGPCQPDRCPTFE